MKHIDKQMTVWSERLVTELKIKEEDTNKLATIISSEVRWLPVEAKREIMQASPVAIKHRYEELLAFQSWMDIVHNSTNHPAITRAQVITQNYICFVYLNEACFSVLRQHLPHGSTSKKCCNYLINNPIRAFRNAIAHSNWCYNADFSGIIYWARKGSEKDEPLIEFEVSQEDLGFWQALARCTAYAAYENLR
jgi:hypothetical protein